MPNPELPNNSVRSGGFRKAIKLANGCCALPWSGVAKGGPKFEDVVQPDADDVSDEPC